MTKTFTEMLYGDIRAMKQQEAVNRMHRLGKTEMVLLDTEAGISLETESHYIAQFALVDALTMGMGFGKGMQAKREMLASSKVVAEINGRHPALAAEQRVGGAKAERSIAEEMKRLRDWKKLNWAHYYGRGHQFDEQSVMRLT